MKRVVITGAGTINSIGQNVSQTINSFKEGRCGISDLKFKDVKIGSSVCCNGVCLTVTSKNKNTFKVKKLFIYE